MDPSLYKNIAAAGELGLLLKHYPWIFTIANLLPYWLVTYLDPNVIPVINQRNVMLSLAQRSSAIIPNNHVDLTCTKPRKLMEKY